MIAIIAVCAALILIAGAKFGPSLYARLVCSVNVHILKDNIAILKSAFDGQEVPTSVAMMLLRLDALACGEFEVTIHMGENFGQIVADGVELFLLRRFHTLYSHVTKEMVPIWLAGEMADSASFHRGYHDCGTIGEYQSLMECGEIMVLVYERLRELGYDFGGHPDLDFLEDELHFYRLGREVWQNRSQAFLVSKYPELAPAIAAANS